MIKQVQSVIDQVITAVEFLFLFTLASGLLVLYAAQRREEALRRANALRTQDANAAVTTIRAADEAELRGVERRAVRGACWCWRFLTGG